METSEHFLIKILIKTLKQVKWLSKLFYSWNTVYHTTHVKPDPLCLTQTKLTDIHTDILGQGCKKIMIFFFKLFDLNQIFFYLNRFFWFLSKT